VNGWTITGFHRIQTGGPLAFTMGTDVAQNGILQPNGQYALYAPNMGAEDLRRDFADRNDMITQYFNTAALVPVNSVPRGIYGNVARGALYGPGEVTTDLAIMRHVPLGSGLRLQLRGEIFNAFNQVSFNNPNTTVSSTTFGRITGSGSGRVIQLAAKLMW
jgi:hypothetical protein